MEIGGRQSNTPAQQIFVLVLLVVWGYRPEFLGCRTENILNFSCVLLKLQNPISVLLRLWNLCFSIVPFLSFFVYLNWIFPLKCVHFSSSVSVKECSIVNTASVLHRNQTTCVHNTNHPTKLTVESRELKLLTEI